MLVLIKGAGDIASGVAHRLFRSGFQIVMTEIPQPTMVRRTVSFGEAIYEGSMEIEGVKSRLVKDVSEIPKVLENQEIPILVDEDAKCIEVLKPKVIVDAIIAKKNTGTYKGQAPLTIGLGPGFTAGEDVDIVVETMRGHYLGKVIHEGSALPDTGVPGEIGGQSIKRLLKSPANGKFIGIRQIGDEVKEGDVVGQVGDKMVKAEISGLLRGLIRTNTIVKEGMKIGDVDPRADREYCFTISDKARAIAGGVLEAILFHL